jgi:hypothetical protein
MRKLASVVVAAALVVSGLMVAAGTASAEALHILRIWCTPSDYYNAGHTHQLCSVDAAGGTQPYTYLWVGKAASLPYGNTTRTVTVDCQVGRAFTLTASVTDYYGFRTAQQTPWLPCYLSA